MRFLSALVLFEMIAGLGAAQEPITLTFSNDGDSAIVLEGDEYAERGISLIKTAVFGGYCWFAKPAILPKGSYSTPYAALSTDGDTVACNGAPVEIRFDPPVGMVTLWFDGAKSPYRLAAYDDKGMELDGNTAKGTPYDYRHNHSITVADERGRIYSVVFGSSGALTLIKKIQYSMAMP